MRRHVPQHDWRGTAQVSGAHQSAVTRHGWSQHDCLHDSRCCFLLDLHMPLQRITSFIHIFIVITWCWEECWPSVSLCTECSLVDAVAKSREGRHCAVRVLSIWAARDLLPAKARPAHYR